MESLICRTFDSTIGSKVFSRGSDAVLSSCGIEDRTVAIVLERVRNEDVYLGYTPALRAAQPNIII